LGISRSVTLGLLSTVATAWAICLVVPGLWLTIERPSVLFFGPRESLVAGVLCISIGNFVFMVLVADRLFPMVARRALASTIEILVFSIGVAFPILHGVGLI
jgi:hypothetical protein